MKLLNKIQKELKCNKNQYNSFGKYHYRSCEDILAAVKPLLGEEGILILNDEIKFIEGRFYVEATATLLDTEGNKIQTKAYAREEENKKGMDASQITGACSSYARKYALNGLFLLDDIKDADTQDNRKQAEQKPEKHEKPTKSKQSGDCEKGIKLISETLEHKYGLIGKADNDVFKGWIKETYGQDSLDICPYETLVKIYTELNKEEGDSFSKYWGKCN
jgi:hypothetical protein